MRAAAGEGEPAPTLARKIVATVFVIAVLLATWKVIDYRMQPPPPPHPLGVESR